MPDLVGCCGCIGGLTPIPDTPDFCVVTYEGSDDPINAEYATRFGQSPYRCSYGAEMLYT